MNAPTTKKPKSRQKTKSAEGIFGDSRDLYPELGECRVARELNFTKIYVSILGHLLMRMKENYESKEAEDEHIRRLSWRAFKAARTACNILFDQRYFDRRFIGYDPNDEFNRAVDAAAT
jgi:hypothetical protein